MSISTKPTMAISPVGISVTASMLNVALSDGRTICVPTEWFPRLAHGTPPEWAKFEVTAAGIHWPDLHEDVAVAGLLRGEGSGESPVPIQRWLDLRRRGKKESIPEIPLPPDVARELELLGIDVPNSKARRQRRAGGEATVA